MDAMLRGKAEELAKEIAVSISTQQELSDVMRLMTKSVIERMLDAEMDVHLDEERGRTVPRSVATNRRDTSRRCLCAGRRGQCRSGRHRLRPQSSQRQVGQDRAGRIRTAGRESRGKKGITRPVAGRERRGQVLAPGAHRTSKIRGLNDIFVACVDGLAGFPDAIRAPIADQSAALHRPLGASRTALRHRPGQQGGGARFEENLSSGDSARSGASVGGFCSSLAGELSDDHQMWRAKWTDIITLFDFPAPIRKAISTTNAIESVNSVIRKFTRNRKIYPNEESALKITSWRSARRRRNGRCRSELEAA